MNKKTFIMALCMVGHSGYAAEKRDLKAKQEKEMALTKQENVQKQSPVNAKQEEELKQELKKLKQDWNRMSPDSMERGERSMQMKKLEKELKELKQREEDERNLWEESKQEHEEGSIKLGRRQNRSNEGWRDYEMMQPRPKQQYPQQPQYLQQPQYQYQMRQAVQKWGDKKEHEQCEREKACLELLHQQWAEDLEQLEEKVEQEEEQLKQKVEQLEQLEQKLEKVEQLEQLEQVAQEVEQLEQKLEQLKQKVLQGEQKVLQWLKPEYDFNKNAKKLDAIVRRLDKTRQKQYKARKSDVMNKVQMYRDRIAELADWSKKLQSLTKTMENCYAPWISSAEEQRLGNWWKNQEQEMQQVVDRCTQAQQNYHSSLEDLKKKFNYSFEGDTYLHNFLNVLNQEINKINAFNDDKNKFYENKMKLEEVLNATREQERLQQAVSENLDKAKGTSVPEVLDPERGPEPQE